tara:strand:+ start:165 stop:404 length:240 start_codon:yes stop_codon:yes gene_type:complete
MKARLFAVAMTALFAFTFLAMILVPIYLGIWSKSLGFPSATFIIVASYFFLFYTTDRLYKSTVESIKEEINKINNQTSI